GYDLYHVGSSRGCGGISIWADERLYNSDTFIAHRLLENLPERVTFELDYASNFKGKALRETKRISLIMGQHLYQCDSRFTIDGVPATNMEVAIGLNPEVKGSAAVFSPKAGTMMIWEKLDGYGLGTAVVINPEKVVKMSNHTDSEGLTQALCIARTDKMGGIRYFSGFGWEGQGKITTEQKWIDYLKRFAAQFLNSPYADPTQDPNFKVHTLDVPAEIPVPAATTPKAK
ncbi:MAG: DUF4861 family protein, partial [Akkermansiaceae bacterium]|nr:DUF4861 family protein [Akkermansiaceae bacterium]